MKLHILSDLHLSCGVLEHPRTDADVVILAGDIARPQEAIAWAMGFDKPVLYVPGNHESYGSSIAATVRQLKDLAAGSPIHVLDGDEVVISGVRFLGATLWTDFLLVGKDGSEARVEAMAQAQRMIRDFQRIHADGQPAQLFTPDDCAVRCQAQAAWLDSRLAVAHDGPTVVITHHAPSPRSIHPRFAGSPLNACFVSDLEWLAGSGRAQLWIHGHTHDSFDYRLGATRVVCNPRGYSQNGVNENPAFNPYLQLEVAC